VDISYLTNRRPTGNPTNLGLAKDYLGFLNEWEIVSGFQGGATISGSTTPIKQMTCTDVKVDAHADGWYRVTETYQSRQFPGAVPIAQSLNAVSIRNTGSSGIDGTAIWAAQEARATQVQAAAQWAALGQSSALPMSPAGSVGESIRQQTGIDPAWNDLQSAVPVAAAAGSTPTIDTATGIGGGATPLTY
jgi:hypothetical protein